MVILRDVASIRRQNSTKLTGVIGPVNRPYDENHQPSFGMSKKSQTKVNFHFVTGNPQSESEKRNVRTIVRSNASNRRWRLARESAAKSKAQNGIGSMPQSLSELSNKVTLSDRSGGYDEKTELGRQERRQRLALKNDRRQNRANAKSDVSQMEAPIKVVNLAQDHFFGALPVSSVSKQSISRMLQGTAVSYARLFPSGKNSPVSQMARDWFQQCLRTRGILHTALFCQAMRAQAVRPGWSALPDNELVLCQTEAVQAVKHKLSQTETACDDESIRIVFSLTWHGEIKQDAPARSPKQSPLADLQSLSLFMGTIACDPIHAQGLANMLSLRGGLEKVDMPGLAFLVSFGDILTASCNLSRPIYSYGSYAQYNADAAVDDEWFQMTHRTDHPLATLGDGFAALHMWLPYDRASHLQLVFCDLADYIRASHDFIFGRPENRNQAVMADQRNCVQHKLMSMRLSMDDIFDERGLFELCWLTGVAYSFIAVFPLAPKAARFDRLACLIKDALSSRIVLRRWSQAPEMVLWATVVGTLCAIGTADRVWYVNLLKQEVDRLGIRSWQDLKLRLLEFLWFPCASDSDGEELWAEIDQMGRISTWSSPEEE